MKTPPQAKAGSAPHRPRTKGEELTRRRLRILADLRAGVAPARIAERHDVSRQTVWNVRHGRDGVDYLDMCLFQRSSDYATAGCINQVQYAVFLCLVARHFGYTAGRFTWFVDNIQIYDRHVEQVKQMLERESVECSPYVWINPEKKSFYDITIDDVKILGYPREEIKQKNPQLKFDLGI